MKHMILAASLAALLVAILSVPAWAGFDEGMSAYERGDYATALREWRPLAEQGDAPAQNFLGFMYAYGLRVPQDNAEAVKWYRKAADQGHAEAQFNLGRMYAYGEGVPQDNAEAVKWYRKAADQGHAEVQYNLGFMYDNGLRVPQDYAEAVKWYRKATGQGNASAQLNLGAMYHQGLGVPQDYVQAHMWFNLAAMQGNAGAVKGRDVVARRMTPAQIATAQRMARNWKPVTRKQTQIAETSPYAASVTTSPIPAALIRKIQRSLAQLGYSPGSADGVPGGRTGSAIRAFQRDIGLPVDGQPSEELLGHLSKEVEPRTPTPSFGKTQPREDTSPPRIDLPGHLTASSDKIDITGRVTDDSDIAALKVRGRTIKIGRDGSFTVSQYVPADGLTTRFEAVDVWGNRSERIVRIIRAVAKTSGQPTFAPLNPTTINGRPNHNALALIIGVERYSRAPKAVFADNDAQVFADYARRALGVPESNIKVLVNEGATRTDAKLALKQWLRGRIETGSSDVYVFFAGHGLASPDGKDLYLLPYDGAPSLLEETAILRNELFVVIGEAKPRSATLFLDTCYSGLSRGQEMLLASARPISITPKRQDIPVGFTVFSAASGKQISSGLDGAKHGLFSYYLMKGMEGPADVNKDRKITAGELHAYVRSNVRQQAIRLGREQIPELVGDGRRVLVRW